VPAAAEMYKNVGTLRFDDSWAIDTAVLLLAHQSQSQLLRIKRTSIPIHNLIRQLPIALHGPQRLPTFPIQRILRPLLSRTKRSLQSLDRRLAPGYHAFVVCFEKYAHAVDDGVRAFEVLRVRRGVEHVAFLP
jgi:hypothetical protein